MSENRLEFFIDGDLAKPLNFTVKRIINAGYTGRNQAEVQKHVEELKALGVPAPEKIPTYFPKAALLLTTADSCEVPDRDNTGEAEYVLLVAKDGIYVGTGSDHTDRKLEITSIPKAKQICPNFISRGVWRLADVEEAWDEIRLRSWIGKNRAELYQEATLAAFMRPEELLDRVRALLGGLEEGTVIFSGTVGALISGAPFSEHFEVEMADEKSGRSLHCFYQVKVMDMF